MRTPLQRLAAMVSEETGNALPPERAETLAEVAARRARATGWGEVGAYVEALAAGSLRDEWRELVPLVTIQESYFFRAPQQFTALRREALPRLLGLRGTTRELRVWSAACAHGEEPATLALVFAEEPALRGWDWRILATDLDERALEVARSGVYGERAVAQVPEPLRERWFARRGRSFEIAAELRARIDYRPLNLARFPYPLPPGEFDLVLLRNLLIYFRRPLQRRVAAEVARRLRPGGLLLLGASETLWQVQQELEAVELGKSFFYRPRGGAAAVSPGATTARPASPRRALAPAPLPPASPALTEEPAPADAPPSAAARALAGLLHDRAGRATEAATAYRGALYLEPDLYQVRLLLAEALTRLGESGRARPQAREALTLLESGRGRALAELDELGVPVADEARARCRALLVRGR